MRLPEVEERMAWAGGLLRWTGILIVVAFVIFRFYVLVKTPSTILGPEVILQLQPDRIPETIQLKRGGFTIYRYEPANAQFVAHPKAVIIFGSGDGGLGVWEDRVCTTLQADGYEMLAYDCCSYAQSDYDLETLQADMSTIAQSAFSRHGEPRPPLIIGGWSMGAEQAVPIAGGPNPPAGLRGLLMISPGSRGRYGLRDADTWDVPPTGKGTYSLSDFVGKLNGLRIAQWDGNLDLLDSTAWLNSLTTTHKAFSFPFGFHDYNGASDNFLIALKQSVNWILTSDSAETEKK